MKFNSFLPTEQLRSYIREFVVSENEAEQEYKVYPSSGMVIGFQYKGQLSTLAGGVENPLTAAGITGIADHYKTFKTQVNTGTVLVYFTETGFTHFASHPAHEIFNLSVSLDDLFAKNSIKQVEEKLGEAKTDQQRVRIVERFFLSQIKDVQTDRLILKAVQLIYESKGSIRIRELNERLFISQSPLEKRFRKIVGTSPKKFASIVRFNTVLQGLGQEKTLTEICYEHNFFDQAHFIKEFKQFTGVTPENFKRLK